MRYIFNFPDIGEGLEEGTILEWYVKKGQEVKTGDNLVQMETDKVVADIPSPKDGTIVALFGEVGEVAIVGEPLVEIEIEGVHGEDAQEEAKKEYAPEPEEEDFEEEEAAAVVGTMETAGKGAVMAASDEGSEKEPEKEAKPERKALATPVARAMAKEMDIDINEVKGTGPSGRVTKADIENFKPAKKGKVKKHEIPTDEFTYEPLSQIRKTISRNMLNSKQSAAHMTVFEEVEISELINIRSRYKTSFADEDVKLTYLPFIVKAVVHALKHHRQINSQMDLENDRMIFNNRYNIGIAVDTAEGLVVPVIKDADQLSIKEIAQQITELADKANSRKLSMDDMKGGTFTITNYGSIGGIFATPVINYPQAGILGVGRIVKKPIIKDDAVVPGNVLALSLSVDHRIVDGGEASRFVNKIMEYLSDPIALIMD
ncbi:MAG: dihydrolipoamide acetyltransferase family protein [Dysgonamonadaceae bacterium]|jgi:pyruvate dehydrogenase E2 component (dihydrolipoamide acetyltransferase)|nr:dihydrolipoamide acetyltransferase family protein [Dysgonamonadaceae bacterium]MDD3726850.1 dihydrolipoamide acetyltransferase family protein [Dysgonamonadaceae bacterium]MDD4246654.1 dihydrolipoamide acetyltransferase family protein [Dysgonamonadaceae bacterium]